jgi:hypothetical protein
LFQNGFEIPKQTERVIIFFRKKYRNRTKTVSVSVCFGSNRKKQNLFRRTPYVRHMVLTHRGKSLQCHQEWTENEKKSPCLWLSRLIIWKFNNYDLKGFFNKQITLVPKHMPGNDFEFCQIFVELLVFKILTS